MIGGIPVHVGEDLSRRLFQRGGDTHTNIDASGSLPALDPGYVARRASRSCRQFLLAPSDCKAVFLHTVHTDPITSLSGSIVPRLAGKSSVLGDVFSPRSGWRACGTTGTRKLLPHSPFFAPGILTAYVR